jgi:hypothetical protein
LPPDAPPGSAKSRQAAATLDRLSNGRALFNLVTGGDPEELAGDGVFLDPPGRKATRKRRRCVTGINDAATSQASSQDRPVGIW